MIKLITFVFCLLTLKMSPAISSEFNECGNSDQARLLAQLIKEDKDQKRSSIRCNKILTVAAEIKAKNMAERGHVFHNLGGSPNSHLRESGYKLPNHYGSDFNSNQVEAISGGYSDAESVWDAFKRSEGHRTHLLGDHKFYLEQDEIGVAFISKWESPHVEYWVVYLTKGYEKNQKSPVSVKDIPNKSMFILQSDKSLKKDKD